MFILPDTSQSFLKLTKNNPISIGFHYLGSNMRKNKSSQEKIQELQL